MLSFGIDTAPQSGVSIRRQDWGPNAEGVWETGIPQRCPGAEPLVGVWGEVPRSYRILPI